MLLANETRRCQLKTNYSLHMGVPLADFDEVAFRRDAQNRSTAMLPPASRMFPHRGDVLNGQLRRTHSAR